MYLYHKLGALIILLLFIGPGMLTAERVGEDPAAYVEDPPRSKDSEPGVKTVFFVTHADEFDRTLGRVLSYEDGGG